MGGGIGQGTLKAQAAFASSSSRQDGAQTAWALPRSLRVFSDARGRCLPHRKHDMVAAPKEPAAVNGEPATLDRYRRPSATTVVFTSFFATEEFFLVH